MKYYKKALLLFLFIGYTVLSNAQDCDCPEWNGTVTPELAVDPCKYTGEGDKDNSLKKFAEYECCMKNCKEAIRAVEKAKQASRKGVNETSKPEKAKEVTETLGYKVLEVDTSQFEAEKERKRLERQQQNQKLEQQEAADLKRQREELQRQREVDQLLAQQERERQLNEQLTQRLTSTIDDISNQWATERAYNDRLSSIKTINATSASGIIAEAQRKQRQLTQLYNDKERTLNNDLAKARQRIMAEAKNETQAAVGNLLGAVGEVAAKRQLEKEERQARLDLERRKERELEKIADKLRKKYKPISKQYLENAMYAVNEGEEDYYLEQLDFSECMIDNANDIILGDRNCDSPNKQTFSKSKSYTGEDYFEAYERKNNSYNESLNGQADTFLELAIEKEPNNVLWLFEKAQKPKTTLDERLVLLKKITEIKPDDSKYTTAFENAKKAYLKREEDQRVLAEQREKFNGDFIAATLDMYPNYDWEKHSNLMRVIIPQTGGKVFVNNIGIVKIDASVYDNVLHFNEGLAGFFKDNRAGFLDPEGKIAIEANYGTVGNFSNGLAPASLLSENQNNNSAKNTESSLLGIIAKSNLNYTHNSTNANNTLGFIDKSGKFVISPQFTEVGDFVDGLSNVKYYDSQGRRTAAFIDRTGAIVIEGKFVTAKPFSNGLAQVTNKKGKEGFVNKDGKLVIDYDYDIAFAFNNDVAIVANEPYVGGYKYFFIDKSGKKLTRKYDEKPKFSEGFAVVKTGGLIGTKYGYVNEFGKEIVEPHYTKGESFKGGRALVEVDNKDSFYIDTSGNRIVEDKDELEEKREAIANATTAEGLFTSLMAIYDTVEKTEGGYRVTKNKKYGYVNETGGVVIPAEYHYLGKFNEGLAVFCKEFDGGFGTKYGYLNTNGKVIIKPKYQRASDFSEGYAAVGKISLLGRKFGHINKEGKVVIKLKYYGVTSFENGKASVTKGNPYLGGGETYFINKNGDRIN